MRYIMFLLGLMFAGTANAIDCEKVPDCESLGYSTEDDPNCADNGYMYCPFNREYKKCVQYDCEALGFTESDKTSWCAEVAHCKGNKNYTLCDTPCIAWNQDTLKTLATSKKCKVVTIKNDITVDSKTTINVAEGTTIDGNGHTLNMSKTNYDVIQLHAGSSLRNMSIKRKYNDTADTQLIHSYADDAVLENVTIIDENENLDAQKYKKIIYSPINIHGKCRLEVVSGGNYSVISGRVHFEDATVDLIGVEHVFVNLGDSVAKNSIINATAKNHLFNGPLSFTLINSTFKGKAWGMNYVASSSTITLKEGTRFEAEVQDAPNVTFVLDGTSEKPVSLVLNTSYQTIKVDVQSLAATLILNGVTYKPKNTAVTTLSDIPSSSDWQKFSQ